MSWTWFAIACALIVGLATAYRWYRKWRIVRWYVDPALGSDLNVGDSPARALSSFAELDRRLEPIVSRKTIVTVIGDVPANDPLNLNLTLTSDATLTFLGGTRGRQVSTARRKKS